MQQRQFTAAQFTTAAVATPQVAAKSAPIALDAAMLKLVAGGVQAAGPNGGWATAGAEGPNGGW